MSINIKNVPVPYLKIKGNNGSTFFLRDGFVLLEPDVLQEAYIVVNGTDTFILNTNVDQPFFQEAYTIADTTNNAIINPNVDQGYIQEFRTSLTLFEFYIAREEDGTPIVTENFTIPNGIDGNLNINPNANGLLLTGEYYYDKTS